MAQHDYNIANQSFPSFRTDLNNALSAIQTCNSGTSRPTGAVAGQIWLDTTSATSPTLKIYDGADDISLATINYTSNTVDWLDSSVTITGLSTTATGTVLTLSDSSLTSSVNLILQNQKEIRFSETTANGVNYVGFKAPASLTADKIWVLPSADGTAGQFLKTDGAGNLSFADGGITGLTTTATGTVMTLSDTAITKTINTIVDNQKEIRFRELTANGTNYVGLKAPASLTVDTTFTLPSADGTSGQVLQTNGSGVLSFSSPSAGSMIFLTSGTASNVASLNLNGYFTSDYDVYKLFIYEAYGASEAYLRFQVATTGSYTVQTTNYFNFMGFPYTDSGGTFYANAWINNLNTNHIDIGYISTSNNYWCNAEITLHNPRSTTAHKQMSITALSGYALYPTIGTMGAGRWKDTTAVTGLKFFMSTGNLYGTFRLYGIKNS